MHYEIKHWAWTVTKEDGSTSRVPGSGLPFCTTELGRPATKVKSECHGSAGHISPAHHCMHEASVLILLVMYYMATHRERGSEVQPP